MPAPVRRFDPYWRRWPVTAPESRRPWLLDRGSLTTRIRARCREFNVRLLFQGHTRVLADEAALLGLRPEHCALARDVLLCCGAVPLVFAHSVLRPRDMRGPWRDIAAMGARPLGAALFADPRIARCRLAFRRIGRSHPLYSMVERGLGQPPGVLWARRSLFVRAGAPLLVTEVFLHTIDVLTLGDADAAVSAEQPGDDAMRAPFAGATAIERASSRHDPVKALAPARGAAT